MEIFYKSLDLKRKLLKATQCLTFYFRKSFCLKIETQQTNNVSTSVDRALQHWLWTIIVASSPSTSTTPGPQCSQCSKECASRTLSTSAHRKNWTTWFKVTVDFGCSKHMMVVETTFLRIKIIVQKKVCPDEALTCKNFYYLLLEYYFSMTQGALS